MKKFLCEIGITASALALLSSLTLVLANSINVYGVKSFDFNYDEVGNLLTITNFDITKSNGQVGLIGIILGVLCLGIFCYCAFIKTKKKDYFFGIINIITLIMIILPKFVSGSNILNMISSFFVLLFVNVYYTLLSILPCSIEIGYGIITLLICVCTMVGFIYNKIKNVN